jgi:hypothetical protein
MFKRHDQRHTTGRAAEPLSRWCRGRGIMALMLGLLLAATPVLAGEQGESDARDLIRSAMIFNICKFVDWPDEVVHGDSLVLGLLGEDLSVRDFSSILGKTVGDLPLTVRQVADPDELGDCQLVFIGEEEAGRQGSTLEAARAKSILTISQAEDFCRVGGVIQLVERRGKLRFFINPRAADESRLNLSSQLLKVAKIVEGD